MKPAPFAYYPAHSAEEALALLARHGEDARLLAGGQSLVPLLNLRMARPAVLIDINRCDDLRYVKRGAEYVACGAMVRQGDAETSADVVAGCPLIAKALAFAGPIAVRNRATVGGTLAHADRTAELPAVAAVMEATMVIDGPLGRRLVRAEAFFLGDLTTAIGPGEMLREVRFPLAELGSVSVFLEAGNRQCDMALAGVAVYVVLRDGVCREARLAVIGVSPVPLRLRDVEAMLEGERLGPALVRHAAKRAGAAVDPVSDLHATARYRRHAVGGLVGRALTLCNQP